MKITQLRTPIRLWRLYSLFALCLVLLVGCGGQGTAPPVSPGASPPVTTPIAQGETGGPPSPTVTPPPPTVPTDRPPPLTLTIGAAQQTGHLGTYCWSGSGGGMCVDAIGILAPLTATVASEAMPWSLELAGGSPAQGSLQLYHWSDPEHQSDDGSWAASRPMDEDLVERIDLPLGQTWPLELVTTLEPGEYLVAVFLQWPTDAPQTVNGDATYGFHLQVP